MKMLNDSLIKENHSKDREIRKLNKDMQHCEQTLISLRNELSNNNSHHTSEVPKKDAEVTADICCSGSQECGDAEPVRDSALCGARLRRLDVSVKSSGDTVRSLRQLNVSLSEEVRALQRVCGALDEQCRAAGLRARFKDDVIHEMRRQLRQAKAKLKELSESNIPKIQKEHDVGPKSASYDSLTIACVQRPRRKHARALELDCDCRSSVYDESDDDHVIVTSTPNTSSKFDKVAICTGDESSVERSPSPPLELSDSCLAACSDAPLVGAWDCSDKLPGDDNAVTATETSSRVDRKINPESQIIGENLQDSTGASGSETEARARSLEDSLLAAARALKNKEETVRVQAESLALAEERLAAASRARYCATGSHLDVTDVSATTQLQDNREIVKTLQDNLSVIEDLYRECFYETARQDEVIAVLRASCRERAPGVTPAGDVALQVENLKAEISNFLNNSTNNDSGVWEAGGGGAVEEQLRRLWAVLQAHCTCGMTEENMKLKETNETMKIQIQNLRQRVSDLQEALENKENLDQRYQRQIEEKEEELQHIKDQLSNLERESRDQRTACSKRASEVKQLEGLLTDKTEELINVQRQCVSQETIITKLREELEKANTIAQENASVRREVWLLSGKVEAWRRELAADARPRADERHRHLAQHYAEKCTQAEELRGELQQARAGGAALCVRARAALHAARDGLRALADHARENEDIISRQELLIRNLREKSSKNISKTSNVSDNDPCCSRHLYRLETRSDNRSFMGAKETPRSKCASSGSKARTGESENADGPPPLAPPRRLLRKKPLCVNRRCQCPLVREASVSCTPCESPMSSIVNGEFSADSLLERVERTHEALELAHRRWCRHEHDRVLPVA